MGEHYRRTRKPRCIKRIDSIVERVRRFHNVDLGQRKFKYGRKEVKIAELLSRIDALGYNNLLRLNVALENHEAQVDEWKSNLIQTIIFEAGKQGLTPEDVVILAGQQFPAENVYRVGGVDLERSKKIVKSEWCVRSRGEWKFLDDLYYEQLRTFYLDRIQPRPQTS